MFKLQPNPTFKAKVAISVAGQVAPAQIEVEFKYLSRPQVRDYFESLGGGKTDAEALSEIIVGWSGPDQAFSREALEMLLDNYPASGSDLFETFRRELLESKRKN